MKISALQKYEPKDWSGLTDEKHLGALFATEPEVVSPVIEQIYKVNLGDDIFSLINKFPTHYLSGNSDQYEWFLQGQDEKNLPLVAAYTGDIQAGLSAVATTSRAGIGRSSFYMEFPEDLFSETDIIVGNKPDLYKVQLVKKSSKGGNTLFEAKLITGDDRLFIPYSELSGTSRWSKDYSLAPQTLSTRGGDTSHTSPFKMENTLSMIRKQEVVPGNMISKGKNKPLAFSWKDQNGKTQTTWISKLDWDFMVQFRRETARLLLFGNSNKMADGSYGNYGDSGYEIKTGAGLRDQIAPSNRHSFNDMSLDYLTEVALGLSVGKLAEDARKFTIGTGEYGLSMIDKLIQDKVAVWLPNQSTNRITGSGNDMGYQGQFRRLRTINGIEFDLYKIPQYDDNVRNKTMHPDGGLAESRRLTLMDFGTTHGEMNIQKVSIKGEEEIMRYIPGLRDPFNPYNKQTKPGMAASPSDGYEIHKAFIGGIMVKNPLVMAEFIPSVLQ